MKTVILTFLLSLAAVSSMVAQGVIKWDNLTSGGPILDVAGDPATSPIQVELWYAPGAGASESNLVRVAGTEVALNPSGDIFEGYFNGGEATLPAAEMVTVQMRAWDPATGTTWEDAEVAVGGIWGKSNLSNVEAVPPSSFPNDVTGWLPFQLGLNVPEPSTFALAGLGAFALFTFRRRD